MLALRLRSVHLIERFTRTDFDTLKYEVTIDDKGAYTRPWSGGWNIRWQYENYDGSPGGEIHEYFCIDNDARLTAFRGPVGRMMTGLVSDKKMV